MHQSFATAKPARTRTAGALNSSPGASAEITRLLASARNDYVFLGYASSMGMPEFLRTPGLTSRTLLRSDDSRRLLLTMRRHSDRFSSGACDAPRTTASWCSQYSFDPTWCCAANVYRPQTIDIRFAHRSLGVLFRPRRAGGVSSCWPALQCGTVKLKKQACLSVKYSSTLSIATLH